MWKDAQCMTVCERERENIHLSVPPSLPSFHVIQENLRMLADVKSHLEKHLEEPDPFFSALGEHTVRWF